MIEILQTERYKTWFAKLRDRTAQKRILVRIERLAQGNLGDAKSVGQGVLELRVDHGPGYRVYFARLSDRIALLLVGGDKRTQSRDIRTAQQMIRELE